MTGTADLMERLGTISAGQWGLLTSPQAKTIGVTNQQLARLARIALLERVRHGVYRVASAPPGSRLELQASWLSLAPERSVSDRLRGVPDVVVSHRSASQLHGLGDLDVPQHEFRATRRRQSRDESVRIHLSRRALTSAEWTVVDGLPVTTVATTVADLAAEGIDGGHLAGVVRDAMSLAHVSTAALETALAPAAHRYGLAEGAGAELLADLLAQAGIDVGSHQVGDVLARRQIRLAIDRAGAPGRSAETTDDLQHLLAPLRELISRSMQSHLDPTVKAISDLVAARLAPITDELNSSVLAQLSPSLEVLTKAVAAPATAALNKQVAMALTGYGGDGTAPALAQTSRRQDSGAPAPTSASDDLGQPARSARTRRGVEQ